MAVSAASGTPSHLPSLPPGLPPHAGLLSREQEMLQNEFYRRAYADPGLAHQVSLINFQEFFADFILWINFCNSYSTLLSLFEIDVLVLSVAALCSGCTT